MAYNFTRVEIETGKFKTPWFFKTQLLFTSNIFESETPDWFTLNCQVFNRQQANRSCKLHFQPYSKNFWNIEKLVISYIKNVDCFSITCINLNNFIETYLNLREKIEQSLLPLFISCCIKNKFYVL